MILPSPCRGFRGLAFGPSEAEGLVIKGVHPPGGHRAFGRAPSVGWRRQVLDSASLLERRQPVLNSLFLPSDGGASGEVDLSSGGHSCQVN